MTYGRFILKNSFRNKRRTALTVLSIGFSLFLLILLQTIIDLFSNPPESQDSALRLVVQRSTAFVDQMPISYKSKLESVPHVRLVTEMQIYGGYYKDPKNIFPSAATDPGTLFDMFPDQRVSEETRRRFEQERTGAVIGRRLIERFKWKEGDRVTLIGHMQPVDLDFLIVGSYDSDVPNQNDAFYFRWDYLDEALGNPGEVAFFWLMADSPEAIPGIKDAVDDMFRNTPAETKTDTEKAVMLNFISMIGNVKFLMRSIAGVVIFTMLLVAASTMAMSIRERMGEIAILKSMGYTRRWVLVLILGEAVFISLLGVAAGCLVANALRYGDFLYRITRGFMPDLAITPQTYALVIAVGVAIGLAAAFVPAFRATGLTITQALRRLD